MAPSCGPPHSALCVVAGSAEQFRVSVNFPELVSEKELPYGSPPRRHCRRITAVLWCMGSEVIFAVAWSGYLQLQDLGQIACAQRSLWCRLAADLHSIWRQLTDEAEERVVRNWSWFLGANDQSSDDGSLP